jgi:general secretion pathway protein D
LGDPNNNNFFGSLGKLAFGQFAILSVPQFSATLRALNEDNDAEFLANPRVVTADNQQAKIEITRNQPVPQLNFNEQTATAVFGGFQDKIFGNKLLVRPSVNKDNFITLTVKPEISNKVGDQPFVFAGATVTSPIIDTRTLDSNVLIKSGDTLAIGGLLQDEQTKARNKVPILGDMPILGYLFQERLNARTKRNLLIFVTPTIISQNYGTGLEDQVSGLHHSGEEYADPNGWRNNAKGAVRLVPTSQRQSAADYPKPGVAPAPAEETEVQFKSSAKDRDF